MNDGRSTAVERRAAVLTAAIEEFAAKGLHGASTEAIAAAAGISHPYLFKLFGTKRDLFLAATDRVYERVREAFRAAATANPDGALWAMGKAYVDLLGRRDELRLLLHGFAAAGDPLVGPVVRRRYVELYRFARDASRADDDAMRQLWSHGMLLTIAAALDLAALAGEEDWIRGLLTHPG